MLREFLIENEEEILAMTEKRSRYSPRLEGIHIFFQQLIAILQIEEFATSSTIDKHESEITEAAAMHGAELLRLGQTISNVVFAYGAICQSITELATTKNTQISANDFRKFNRCLDVAIAGAVTGYQSQRNAQETNLEIEHLRLVSRELRGALTSIDNSIQLIKNGNLGFDGIEGQALGKGLQRIGEIIERSLTVAKVEKV